MHTGIISFCDRVVYNIKSTDTKQQLLTELECKYNVRILQKQWVRLEKENLDLITKTTHFMTLRSNGNPYYMYFGKYQDVNTLFYIDKKVQPGYQLPRIILGRGQFDNDLFKDTLIDCEMVKDVNAGWVCLIHDLIVYRGTAMRHTPFPQRIQLLINMFHNMYIPDDTMDVCLFHIKQYKTCSLNGMNELIELSKELPYTSRGLYFVPNMMNQRQKLFNFDESLIKKVFRKVKDNPEFQKTNVISTSSSDIEEVQHRPIVVETEGERMFYLKKTENPDIFDIYSSDQSTQSIGYACVSTMQTSRILRTAFRDATVAMYIKFICTWNKQFERWMPIRTC